MAIIIIIVIIFALYILFSEKSASTNEKSKTQIDTVNNKNNNVQTCPVDAVNAANEAIRILEEGEKLYFDCMNQHPERDSFVGAVMGLKREENSHYAVTIMCSYPELVSACEKANIFSKFIMWTPVLRSNGSTDYMKIKRIGLNKVSPSSWEAFERKTNELVKQKHPQWVYNGQDLTRFTVVFE